MTREIKKELKKILDEVDKDKDGTVDFEEFIALFWTAEEQAESERKKRTSEMLTVDRKHDDKKAHHDDKEHKDKDKPKDKDKDKDKDNKTKELQKDKAKEKSVVMTTTTNTNTNTNTNTTNTNTNTNTNTIGLTTDLTTGVKDSNAPK